MKWYYKVCGLIFSAPFIGGFTPLEGFEVAKAGSAFLRLYFSLRFEFGTTQTTRIAVIGEPLAGIFPTDPNNVVSRRLEYGRRLAGERSPAGDHFLVSRAGKTIRGYDREVGIRKGRGIAYWEEKDKEQA